MAHVSEALSQRVGKRRGFCGRREVASSCGRQASSHAGVCGAKRGAQQRDCAERIAGRNAQASVERGSRRAWSRTVSESEKTVKKFSVLSKKPGCIVATLGVDS